MNELWLHSTKYDGSLHYRHPLKVVEKSERRLITSISPGYPVESYRGKWNTKRNQLSVFWVDRPYVFHVIWEDDWQPKMLYTDIATGTKWEDGVVTYVDMDLDVFVKDGVPGIHLDDEDEVEEHGAKGGYRAELVRGCRDAVEEVRRLLEARELPFSTELFKWRPGEAVGI